MTKRLELVSFIKIIYTRQSGCVATAKVQLPAIETPSETLTSLLTGTDPHSNLFLKSIRTFHFCFRITSFGATEIAKKSTVNALPHFHSTFKLKGQNLSQSGSLVPMTIEPHNFLQIYLIGSEDAGMDARCSYNNLNSFFARCIVSELEALFNEYKGLLKVYKSHIDKLQSNYHTTVNNLNKTPAGEHICRFNAPVVDDIAGIMIGDGTSTREIMICRKNNIVQFIADIHRLYDAVQYPLMFWKGQDGCCINIKQRDSATGAKTNKNGSLKVDDETWSG